MFSSQIQSARKTQQPLRKMKLERKKKRGKSDVTDEFGSTFLKLLFAPSCLGGSKFRHFAAKL
jgi:hypothetical protein